MRANAWRLRASAWAWGASLGVLGVPSLAHGAGLGNLTYTDAELEKPIANFGGEGAYKWPSGPGGSNTVLMLRSVMVIMGSNDSGAPPGSFHFYDVKDPRNPKLLKTYDNTPETTHLRELHAMPVAMIDGKDILVFPSTSGLQFFDFTDPMKPVPTGAITLSGVNGGDYDNSVWMLSWAWPYVYAGSTGNGVFIVDATDPAKPSLVTKIASGELGNFRVGPTYAAGNYLVVANMDQGATHYSVLDVGVPKSPFLLATGTTPASLYSSLVIGDRIYGAGTNGDYAFMKWNATSVTPLMQGKSGKDRGGYCTYQSGYAICGQSSEGYKKWDTRDENAPKLVGHGVDPNGVGGDFDFATVLGNLVYLGNDHGTGAALIPHQTAPDTVAPQVVKVYPNDGETKQPLSTRITVYFTEDVDLDSVNSTNIVVRKNGSATPLDGVFSRSSFNAISFGAKQPLSADTTYEVAIPAGGLKDLVGNPIADAVSVRFSTGAMVQGAVNGGAGGASAGGAGPNAMGGVGGAGAGSSSGGDTAAPSAGMSAAAGTSPVLGGSSAGGVSTGGAVNGPSTGDPAGCGCSVPGRSSRGGSWWLASLAAAWLSLRRPRRRRASSEAAPG